MVHKHREILNNRNAIFSLCELSLNRMWRHFSLDDAYTKISGVFCPAPDTDVFIPHVLKTELVLTNPNLNFFYRSTHQHFASTYLYSDFKPHTVGSKNFSSNKICCLSWISTALHGTIVCYSPLSNRGSRLKNPCIVIPYLFVVFVLFILISAVTSKSLLQVSVANPKTAKLS